MMVNPNNNIAEERKMGTGAVKTRRRFHIFSRHQNHQTTTSSSNSSSSSSSNSSSSSSSGIGNSITSSSGFDQPPKDFLCPISGRLMADPVILPTGQTFERGCIQARHQLGLEHSDNKDQGLLTTPLVPNLALRSTIFNWCDSHGVERPRPISKDDAVELLSRLKSALPDKVRSEHMVFLAGKKDDDSSDSPVSSPTLAVNDTSHPPPLVQRQTKSMPSGSWYSSSYVTSSSSYASFPSDELVENQTTASPLEEQILTKLKSSRVDDQSEGLVSLRQMTREKKEERTVLCTQNILSSLRPFLLSRFPNFQSNAVAAVVNLSLDPSNKMPIIRSGAIPPLVSALKALHTETRSHAVAAIFSLSMDESSKAAIGALGALPPLVDIFSKANEDLGTRRDAALALYHLSSTCSTNRLKLSRMGAVRILLGIVLEEEEKGQGKLVGVSLMVIGNLTGCTEGRAALMDAGAVEVVVGMMRRIGNLHGLAWNERRERCMQVLYGLSKGSLRFRGLAKAVGAEEVLIELVEEDGSEGEGGGLVRDMAKKMLSAMSAEGCRIGDVDNLDVVNELTAVISDPAVVAYRGQHHVGRFIPTNGFNSSEF